MVNNSFKKLKLTANILFSGIGCQEIGFKNSNVFDIEVINTSEINKEAVLSYAAINCGMTNEMVNEYKDYPTRIEMAQYLTDLNLGYEPEKDKTFDWFKLTKRKSNELEKYWLACKLTKNLGDIRNIKELQYADFWTVSFCCQDISISGKMKGLKLDSGIRSSLLWDNIRLLNRAKDNNILPKYIMFENVKNLVSKRFIDDFNGLISILDEIGFNTYWKILNAKDCGIPQNRERVFVIAIRKDVDCCSYEFPKPFDNGLRLKDILEENVDDKFYLSEEVTKKFKYKESGVNVKQVGWLKKSESGTEHQSNIVYSDKGYARTLVAVEYKSPLKILKKVGQIYGTEKEPNPQTGRIYDEYGLFPTIDSNGGGNRMPKILKNEDKIKIRKLTPRECFVLMGLTFDDCDKSKNIGISNTHLYRQAGNGIVTDCCKLLAEHLYKAQYDDTYVCTDEKMVNFHNPQSELNSACVDNELIFVGGIDGNLWLKDGKYLSGNFRQGYRVYDSNGIACSIMTNGGGIGSHTGLYTVDMPNFLKPRVD